MRPGQQNKRGRGRGNNGGNGGGGNNNNNGNFRKGSNPLTRTFDSSGPDVKIRGTAQHIAEKYATLARDAQSSGDRVMAENYLQHAEHYNRIIAAAQAQMQERFHRDDRHDYDRNDRDDDGGLDEQDVAEVEVQDRGREPQPVIVIDGSGPQPVIEGVPAEVALEAETAAPGDSQPRERSPRRRGPVGRPRRQPRQGQAAGDGEQPVIAQAEPAPAEVAE